MLKYSGIINKSWNGLNILTPSLCESGTQSLYKFEILNEKDLSNFSTLYIININASNINNLKTITESKLLNYSLDINKTFIKNKLLLDQHFYPKNNIYFFNKVSKKLDKDINNYLYLPSSMFYENEETFINTEGLTKRTTKLIFRKKTKNNWQILRRIFKQFKNNLTFLNNKDNQIIFFNTKKINNFKNFVNFNYIAAQSLTNLSFYLNIKTETFVLNESKKRFKKKTSKINNTKIKYWLDDFFSGGKDEYSQNSLILTNCSRILRTESTNFF
jgi:NADH dehydrogenase/NADH:ubiquinone oxidoreductase subunit G